MGSGVVGFGNSWVTKNGLIDVRRSRPAADPQALADRLAIIETVQAYAWCVDERRMDVFGDLFSEDAVFRIVIADAEPVEAPTGREAIVGWMSDYMDGLDFQMRHQMVNVLVVEQGADSASVLSYLLLTATTRERSEVMATACYSWELVREDETWRVAEVVGMFDRTYG